MSKIYQALPVIDIRVPGEPGNEATEALLTLQLTQVRTQIIKVLIQIEAGLFNTPWNVG